MKEPQAWTKHINFSKLISIYEAFRFNFNVFYNAS